MKNSFSTRIIGKVGKEKEREEEGQLIPSCQIKSAGDYKKNKPKSCSEAETQKP